MLKWEKPDQPVIEYEIQCESVGEPNIDRTPSPIGFQHFPKSISVPGRYTEKRIDGLVPSEKYCFRIRSKSTAGWGIWSYPIVAEFPDFPLVVEYTGEIVEIVIPCDGLYLITAKGAKAADGETRKGGKGAIIEAKFYLSKYVLTNPFPVLQN